jgi:predicted phage terminase large subunit-like protein
VTNFELRRLLAFQLRSDFPTFLHGTFQTLSPAQPFISNWHIAATAWHLQLCLAGRIKRLLITQPPRSLKSISTSVAFPAFALGHNPSLRIICASYSESLSRKHSLDCRTVVESDWYRRIFPYTRISREKNTELDFVTTRQGFRYSTSVGGTLTGRGGDIVIIDDPLKAEDALSNAKRSAANDWYERTLYSRLDDKREGVIIVVMQRVHVEDLAGHLLSKEKWVHLNLPAIAEVEQKIEVGPRKFYTRRVGEVLHEAREPREVLDQTKIVLGNFNFSSQYQQCPIPAEGEIVKWEWFERYDELPPRAPGDTIVQSWDTASKAEELSDYSVCSTWQIKNSDYYLIEIVRQKLAYPELRRLVVEQARRFQTNSIIIEDKGSGISLIQDLRGADEGVPYPIAFTPEADKVTRMSTQSAKIEARHVFLPRRAEWLEDLRTELLQFPHGRHDDQIDSISQFLNWIDQRQRNRVWVTELPF